MSTKFGARHDGAHRDDVSFGRPGSHRAKKVKTRASAKLDDTDAESRKAVLRLDAARRHDTRKRFQTFCGAESVEAMTGIAQIAFDPSTEPRVKVRALKIILDRAFGPPRRVNEVEEEKPDPPDFSKLSDAEFKEFRRLARKIRGQSDEDETE